MPTLAVWKFASCDGCQLSLLDLDETSMEGSYLQIAAVLRQHGSAHLRDREELFRRMLFNVLCGNRDDHLKNHALLHDGNGWRLSPAFDIVPQTGIVEPVQAIAVGTLGGIPTIENCLSRCGELGLAHRLVVDVEFRVEQLAHARLDTLRQLARDDHQRLLPVRH